MRADDDLRELGEALHSRLLAEVDLSVTAAILETFLPKLFARLRAQFRHYYDLVDTEQAALDTLASYFDTPEKFDPAKGSLLGYLVMDASGNLKNALKLKKNSVRFDPPATEEKISGALEGKSDESTIQESSPLVRRVCELVPDSVDREIVRLMLSGVRSTEEYSEVLQILHLPIGEQRKVVNRRKQRLKRWLKRKARNVDLKAFLSRLWPRRGKGNDL